MYIIIIIVFNLIEIQLVAESIQLVGYLELSPYKIMNLYHYICIHLFFYMHFNEKYILCQMKIF